MTKTSYAVAGLLFGLAISHRADAATHTWIPLKQPLAVTVTLPTVTVTGHIDWGPGGFDTDVSESADLSSNGSSSAVAMAILQNKTRAVSLSNVCTNPSVSSQAKATAGTSDPTTRWLAAEELFNSVQLANLWSMYQNAYGGINLVVNGTNYLGYKVYYADGSQETWLVNPGYRVNQIKLYDTPLPNSLKPPGPNAINCLPKN